MYEYDGSRSSTAVEKHCARDAKTGTGEHKRCTVVGNETEERDAQGGDVGSFPTEEDG